MHLPSPEFRHENICWTVAERDKPDVCPVVSSVTWERTLPKLAPNELQIPEF